MDPNAHSQVVAATDFLPFVKVDEDGRVQRLRGFEIIPPGLDTKTNVQSKDVTISSESRISARLFLPKITDENQKLPLLVYYHGGGFIIESPFSPYYHTYLNAVVSKANALAVSIDYRMAPEHPVPTSHEDSWVALKWVASHFNGHGPDEWLNRYADMGRVFVAGDSAGANLAHHMGIRVGTEVLKGLKLQGMVLIHPYFWGSESVGQEQTDTDVEKEVEMDSLWHYVCRNERGVDDPLINPSKDPNLKKLGCGKVLVFVAGKDALKYRGWYYKDVLDKSGWNGVVKVKEDEDEVHVFHLLKPNCEKALVMLDSIASFINEDF